MSEYSKNIKTVESTEILFREGDPADCAYVIESGHLDISTGKDDKEVVLCQLGPGDIVGEMGVIDCSPRTATAKAVGDVRLVMISRDQLTDRISNADPVLKLLVKILLDRYRTGLDSVRGSTALNQSVNDLLLTDAVSDYAQRGIDKIRLESELRQALEGGQLSVRYQPIFNVAERRVAGFEALTRWFHPTRGPISPAQFISLAEETSLIAPVGLYVFEQACSDLKRLIEAIGGDQQIFMSINVSPRQIGDSEFIEHAAALANQKGLDQQQIKLEITESLATDIGPTRAWIECAHEHGFQVSIDDFGTGYSALSGLDVLEPDIVKIDQAFVRRLEHERSRGLLRGLIGLIKSMASHVVVEGVETEEQLEFIANEGCDFAQGYLFGQSLEIDDALKLAIEN